MSQEKLELPNGWKKINFYSLNLAYCFFVLFLAIQVPTVSKILIKAFGQTTYDTINGWVLILLLVTSAGAGILSFVRIISIKKILGALEDGNKTDP